MEKLGNTVASALKALLKHRKQAGLYFESFLKTVLRYTDIIS